MVKIRNFFKYLKNGLLFYWYTGEKKIAVTGFFLSSIINLILLFLTVGNFGIIIFILMLIMDHLIILFLAVYLIIRNFIQFDFLDSLVIENIFILLICLFINRLVINLTAEKIYKYNLDS